LFFMEMKELWERLGKTPITLENLGDAALDENAIKDINQGKISSLKQSIREIEKMIKQREEVSDKIVKETDSLNNKLENLILSPSLQKAEDVVKEKIALRQKQIEISELQLTEKVNCWRDVALLKKELRENQMELNEKETRIEMLNKLLE
jgi:hypothetical protein